MMPAEQVDAVRFVALGREGSLLLEEAKVAAERQAARGPRALVRRHDWPTSTTCPSPRKRPGFKNLRLSTTESLLWAELDLGRPVEVVAMARRAVLEHPTGSARGAR